MKSAFQITWNQTKIAKENFEYITLRCWHTLQCTAVQMLIWLTWAKKKITFAKQMNIIKLCKIITSYRKKLLWERYRTTEICKSETPDNLKIVYPFIRYTECKLYLSCNKKLYNILTQSQKIIIIKQTAIHGSATESFILI